MQTIRGLKSFITARNNSLAGTLDCTTVGVDELVEGAGPGVYPNPAAAFITVVLPKGLSMNDLLLVDAMGRRLPVRSTGSTVDLTGMAPGLYVLTTNTGTFSTRFVKD